MITKLEEINASAYQYQLSIAPLYEAICEPLKNLGINYFGYMKIFPNGSYLSLINHLQYQKIYFSSIENEGEFFTRELKFLPRNQLYYSPILNDLRKFSKNKNPIIHLLYDLDIWNVLSVYRISDGNYIEAYNFTGRREDTFLSGIYLNNIEILEWFIGYFNEKAKDIIDTTDKRKLGQFQQKFNLDIGNKMETASTDIHYDKQKQTSIITKTSLYPDYKLTMKELECLSFLALGNSVKEIASYLELSPRTVETHLNNIKNKTGFYNRSDLVKYFIQRDPLGFITNLNKT